MIFVTVGTNEAPFERLLRAVDALELGDQLVVQTGPARVRPAGARCVEFLPFDEVAGLIREAQAVVTHAGVGSVMVALASQKRPIVVPRLQRYGEAVDDHQLVFARRMGEVGLATVVEDETKLRPALRKDHRLLTPPRGTALAAELRAFLACAVRGDA